MTTLLQGSMKLSEKVQQFFIHIGGKLLHIDLYVMGFEGFHLILGLQWMKDNFVSLDTTHREVWKQIYGEVIVGENCNSDNFLSTLYT